jgi:hypothetical protein
MSELAPHVKGLVTRASRKDYHKRQEARRMADGIGRAPDTCQRIIGEPPGKGREPQRCGKPAVPGKSWCAACDAEIHRPPTAQEKALTKFRHRSASRRSRHEGVWGWL